MDLHGISIFEDKIQKIISLTSDSFLLSYHFSDNILNIEIELEDGEILNVTLPTFYLYAAKLKQKGHENIGILQYKRLRDYLEIENGCYTISGEFKEIMKMSREKLSLALGLKADIVSHLIYFRGYDIQLAFLVNYNYNIEYIIR